MKTKIIIPDEAKQLNEILKKLNYTKENPYILPTPIKAEQQIDLPGFLDFAQVLITSVWYEENTFGFKAENEPNNRFENTVSRFCESFWTKATINAIVTLIEDLKSINK